MNYPDSTCPRWCYPDNAEDYNNNNIAQDYNNNNNIAQDDYNNIADMFGDYTTDDLFEVVRRGGGGSTLELEEPAVSCHRLPPRLKPPTEARLPEMLPSPPSDEDEMAELLDAIVKGAEHDRAGGACGWMDNNGRRAPSSEKSSETTVEGKGMSVEKSDKLRTAEDTTKETGSEDSRKRRRITARAMRHHVETHKLAEKRRRSKINERLKTLQHLVPGCDKSSYNSTLEQTIQYMKSLQQQNQTLTGGPSPPAAAAMNPVVQPLYVPPGPPATLAPMVVLGPPPTVPLVPVFPLPHYHYPAPMVMMAAAARPLYQATPTPRFAPTACSLGRGSRSSTRGKE